MYERRIKILVIFLLLPTVVLAARLVQLQVLRKEGYDAAAARMLVRPARYYPPLRGDITDCQGRRLAFDTPSWNICMQYAALRGDGDELRAFLRRANAYRPGVDPAEELARRLDDSWQAVAEVSGMPADALRAKAVDICQRVERVKAAVEQRTGIETTVLEERIAHPLIQDLTQDQQVAASLKLHQYPWLEVQASHTRQYAEAESLTHLLGRLGAVDPLTLQHDPWADDDLAAYRLNDLRGISGAEALGESWLRGRRGKVQLDINGQQLCEPVEPINGRNFRLTIDSEIQQALYERLAAAVEATAYRTGGSAVVLHVPTRQVLAMVDYPSPKPEPTLRRHTDADQDAARQPLLFRALRGQYPPGSTVKTLLMAGALTDKSISEQTNFTCYGRMFEDYPDRWRCTGTHWAIDPITALQHSCNVYFYHAGERMGVPRLREWLSMFGLGRATGCGLPAEAEGCLPADNGTGQARLCGVGQGQLLITPLQAANLTACLAEGKYRPVSLWLDDPAAPPATELPVSNSAWRAMRQGMYLAVNEQGGTAYGLERGTLDDAEYVMLGKTGSAEALGVAVEWTYFCHFADGRVEEINASSKEEVLSRYPADQQPTIAGWRTHRRYPPDQPPTHAWFIGYLAARGQQYKPVSSQGAAFAIAVLIEYCGHGGEFASPVAREMMQIVLAHYRAAQSPQPALDPNAETTSTQTTLPVPDQSPPSPSAESDVLSSDPNSEEASQGTPDAAGSALPPSEGL